MKKKRVSILIGWMCMVWVFMDVSQGIGASKTDPIEKSLIQKRRDLKDINKQLSLTKEREKEMEGKEFSVLESLSKLENELYQKEKELKKMESQLGQTKEKLYYTKNQMVLLNQGMEKTKKELVSRLTALYKMGKLHPEILMLSSQSYVDLLRIDKYLRIIIDFDAHLVSTYRHQMVLKKRYQEELIRDQFQWQRNITGIEEKRADIQKTRRAKHALLKSIQNKKVVYQRVILELEERAKGLQTLIEKLEREKRIVAYAKPRDEILMGKLNPPVEGRLISSFKEKGQNGVEIQAPMGAEIRAILSGKVVYADWFKGFGNMVIIDHGDHTFTVSAYCSQLLKKEGDPVSRGEPIALVGNAGSLKGPCLYFEIRHRGKVEDPMNWIAHLGKAVPDEDETIRK